MTYANRKSAVALVFCLMLLTLIWTTAGSAAELRRTFLLEVGARYEVSVRIRTNLENAPTLASVYIHTDQGQYLRSTQLSRGIGGPGQWQEVSSGSHRPTQCPSGDSGLFLCLKT